MRLSIHELGDGHFRVRVFNAATGGLVCNLMGPPAWILEQLAWQLRPVSTRSEESPASSRKRVPGDSRQ
jgi:hypothetical protein